MDGKKHGLTNWRFTYVYVGFVSVWWPVLGLNATVHKEMWQRVQYPGYDATIRPVTDAGDPVEVEVDLVLNSIGAVDYMDMTWTASFYLRQEWSDSRLVLDGTDSVVRMAGDQVSLLWLPDMFFSNSQEGRKHDVTVPNHLLYVNTSTGRVLYSQRLIMVLNCKMDLTKFPHDNQTCTMDMESYSYTTDDLVFKWSSKRDATSLQHHVYIPDFRILDITTEDCSVTYAIAIVKIQREIGFYVMETYVPNALIVILSWSFWVDHEAVQARISVGLLTVLTLSIQLAEFKAQMPRVFYAKAIDVWMTTNLVFVFAAYMEYALVTVLSRRYKKAMARKAVTSVRPAPTTQRQDVPVTKDSVKANPSPKAKGGNSPDPSQTALSSSLDERDPGRKVDMGSRVVFPLAYVVFNIVYWPFYV